MPRMWLHNAWQMPGMFLCWLASHLAAERQSILGELIGHLAMHGMHPRISPNNKRSQCPFGFFFLVFIVLELFVNIAVEYEPF
jgi:hypothetical protein